MSFEIVLHHRIGDRPIALHLETDARLAALVGRSGAGKTSVLNAIAGLLRPDSGRIVVDGEVLFDSERRICLPPQRRRAGYVFQDGRLFPHMNVAANLDYGRRLARRQNRWADRDELIDLLGIGALLKRWPATLSGGEARRVAIGRALLAGPRFLLLDEPLSSLDRERADAMMGMIERIRDEIAIPMLLVSHDPDEVGRLAGHVTTLG